MSQGENTNSSGSVSNPTSGPTRLFPLWDLAAPSAVPMGLPMCQNRLAIPTWSYAMERHPPARIVELGTYAGGFVTALAVHAHQIGTRVVTYDRSSPNERVIPLGRFLGVDYRWPRDIWACEAEIGALVREPGSTFLLCDGGDKRRELATFARYLKPGDVIAAHDYHVRDSHNAWWGWGEINLEDGAAVAAVHDLEPFLQEHFDMAAWLAYRRRG